MLKDSEIMEIMETNFNPEGSPWFWKLFGAALIGSLGVLLMVILNAIHANTLSVRFELITAVTEHKEQIDSDFSKLRDQLKELEVKIAASDEFKTSVKEKLLSIDSSMKERTQFSETSVATMYQSDKEQSDQIRELRERILKLEEKLKSEEKLK